MVEKRERTRYFDSETATTFFSLTFRLEAEEDGNNNDDDDNDNDDNDNDDNDNNNDIDNVVTRSIKIAPLLRPLAFIRTLGLWPWKSVPIATNSNEQSKSLDLLFSWLHTNCISSR